MDWDKVKFMLLLMGPGLALFFIFAIYPIGEATVGSFLRWEGFEITGFSGLANWKYVLTDSNIIDISSMLSYSFPMGALPQNLLWMLIHVPVSMLLGLGLALLLSDLKGGNIIRSIIFVGFTTTTVAIGIIMLFIFDPDAGIFNAFLRLIGLGGWVRNWLYESQYAIYCLILGGIWIQTGFSMLLYNSGLAGLDPALIEAAKIDGASAWQRFKHVIWPRLRPITMVVLIMSMIWVLRVFGLVWAVGGASGGPNGIYQVLGVEVYRSAWVDPIEYGRAITVALVELIIALPLAVYIGKMRRI